jgi:hypothetical protein
MQFQQQQATAAAETEEATAAATALAAAQLSLAPEAPSCWSLQLSMKAVHMYVPVISSSKRQAAFIRPLHQQMYCLLYLQSPAAKQLLSAPGQPLNDLKFILNAGMWP